jgi:predicted RNA-binding protein associated with RNAse of E/G family
MEVEKVLKDMDEIKLAQRRFELITVARYRDKSKIKSAMKIQDELRNKSKGVKWNSTEELRKWREAHYGHSSS